MGMDIRVRKDRVYTLGRDGGIIQSETSAADSATADPENELASSAVADP